MGDSLEQAAQELYGLPPGEFTTARNARAAAAKTAGDRELAASIRSLAKPSVAAWAVNALVRHRGDDVSGLLEVGERMREATETGDRDAVRQLGHDRQKMLAAAATGARELGGSLGVAVSESAAVEVQQTLQAAVVDRAAAAAVRSGLLVRTFSSSGVDPVDLADAVALPSAAPLPPPTETGTSTSGASAAPELTHDVSTGREVTHVVSTGARKAAGGAGVRRTKEDRDREAAERESARERAAAERAERALAAAKQEAEEARQDAEDAAAEVATLELRIRDNRAHHESLADEQQELRERLDEVQSELTETNVTAARLRKERASAARDADAADRLATRARARLARLTTSD